MKLILSSLPNIAKGSIVTLELFALTLLFALPLGLLLALGNISKCKPLRLLIRLYILVLRGTPLMLQILFIYFGVPIIFQFIGIPNVSQYLNNFLASVIAFVLNYAAYFAEIFRGGITSINKGQYEASYALGMPKWMAMRLIILPQAFRRVIPAMSNEVITLVKDTSLVQVIALSELLREATYIVQREGIVTPFIVAGLFYLCMTIVLTWIFNKLEKKNTML